MNQATVSSSRMEDARRMDRFFSATLFVLAVLSFGGAVLLLLNGFIEYLQIGSWRSTSLLQFLYDTYLLKARWFLTNRWSWWIHDGLQMIPTYAALLVICPITWWLSGRFGAR